MPQLRVTLAGALSLERDRNRAGPRAFTGSQLPVVTVVMLLRRGQEVPVGELAEQLWPITRPEHWRTAVRGLVSRLRHILVEVGYDDDVVVAGSGTYRACPGDVEVDVETVPDHLSRARGALDAGEVETARQHASAARQVASRPVLAGIDAPILSEVRRELDRQRLDALDLLAACRIQAGEHADAVTAAREALRLDPFREASWRHLLAAHARAGNVAVALRGYERMRRLFADQLGADPSPQTQALHAELLRSGSEPRPGAVAAGPPIPAAAERVPYRGLLAFRPEDVDLFFGRDVETQELLDRLSRVRAVAVTGPSGSGKSSLVRAGLLPALAAGALPDADTWTVVALSPGGDPLKALAAALADTGDVGDDPVGRLWVDDDAMAGLARSLLRSRGAAPTARLLVVVDQAEELFTVCDDQARRRRFVAALLEGSHGRNPLVRVVLTLRADFLPQASTVPELAELLSTSHYVLAPLDGDGYEAAIVGPARQVGVDLEPGLVGRILADVAGEPGALPLLQHALLEVWHQRDDGRLTLAAYEAAGGVAGALAHRAEEVYRGLDDDQRAVVRRLLLRTVSPGRGTGDTRRRVTLAELRRDQAGADVVDAIIGRLVDARLLTTGVDATGEAVVEVAHEALISGWPRLAGWIAETREDLLLHERLAEATAEWLANDRSEGFLLRGGRLVQHEAWTATTTLQLALAERELVTASQHRADEQVRAKRRRQRLTTTTVGVAALVALVLAGFAWSARNDAARERDNAEARRLLTSSREVAATDPELSLLLALEAAQRLAGDPEAAATLHGAVAANRTIVSVTWPDEESRTVGVDMTDDGATMAWAGQPGGVVEVRDVESGAVHWQHDFDHENGQDLLLGAKFTRSERELAVTVQFSPRDNARATDPPPDAVGVHVFDVETGEVLRRLPTSECGAWHAAPGRAWGAIVSDDGEDHMLVHQYSGDTIADQGCPQLGSSAARVDLVRIDVQSGAHETLATGATTSGHFFSALSRDGRVVAMHPFDGPRTVVEVDSGKVLLELPRVAAKTPVALTSDGSRVAFTADDVEHRMAIHDVATGELVSTIAGHAEDAHIVMARFSLDGRWLYSTSTDGTLRIWNVETGEELDRISGFNAPAAEPRLSRDRTRLLTSTFSLAVRVTDLTHGGRPEVPVPRACEDVGATTQRFPTGAVVRGGRLLVHVGCDAATTPGRAKVIELGSGQLLSDVPALGMRAAISDDGSLVAAQDWSIDGEAVPGGTVVVSDAATGDQVARLDGLCTWDWASVPPEAVEDLLVPPAEVTAAQRTTCRRAPEHPFAAFNQGMVISPDNRLVAAHAETTTGPWVVVSDVASGAVRAVLPGDGSVFAQDRGELIVLELTDRRLAAYETEEFSLVRESSDPNMPFFHDLHYLPGRGEVVARSTRTGDARIFRFDIETLELASEMREVHESEVTDLTVNVDAGLMASGSAGGRARVRDLETGELVHEVVLDEGLVSVALSDDGRILYTTTASGPVRGWLLDHDELLEFARSRLARDFTAAECTRYFGDRTCSVDEA